MRFLFTLTVMLALLFGVCLPAHGANDWRVAMGPLLTPWAAEVSPTNSLPDYPRPQMVRADWMNLNGLWDYAITSDTLRYPTSYEGKILVPFPVESALSGIMRDLDEQHTLWYHRTFAVSATWAGRRVILRFGAVDWEARVFVNGKEMGRHRGGYDAFSFDITDALKPGGMQELSVAVLDPTEGDQPRGKQSRKPEGIFYRACSGIWQTAWLEPVPTTGITGLKVTPDVDAGVLRLRVFTQGEKLQIEATAMVGQREAGRASGAANTELVLPLTQPRLWSPDDPFLYDLQVVLKSGTNIVDEVKSYFGMVVRAS